MRTVLLIGGMLALPMVPEAGRVIPQVAVDQQDPRLARLQQFFAQRDCPLRDAAADFLIAADNNSLDWRLLPSISIIESSGGKDYRNNNVFGWDSCRERFSSVKAGIHYVATQLARSKRYRDKDLDNKLSTYNPVPDYGRRVRAVMDALGAEEMPRVETLD